MTSVRAVSLACLCAMAWAAHAAASNNTGAWTAMTLDFGSVRFDAHVAGREVTVRLGSASPSNSVNEPFVQSLPSASSITPDGLAVRELPPLVDMPLLITSRRIVLPSVYRLEEMPFDVHAGRDFFSGHIVQLDYPNRRLRALDQDALSLRTLANVPARRVDRITGTQIQIDVAGKPLWGVIATEYSGALMIPRGVAQKHGWVKPTAVQLGEIVDAYGNEYVNEGFTLPFVGLGPFRVDDVDVVILEEGESPLAGDDAHNTLIVGNQLLQHFQISIDLDRAYFHVQTASD